MFDYFYGLQADQFSFYRVPKVLFTHGVFRSISAEAKTLYGILLDRMNLSAKNGWVDAAGRVYIIFTLDEVMEALGCAKQKAVKLLDELEAKAGLIERKRQGLCKPNLIYVKNFITGTTQRGRESIEDFSASFVRNHGFGMVLNKDFMYDLIRNTERFPSSSERRTYCHESAQTFQHPGHDLHDLHDHLRI